MLRKIQPSRMQLVKAREGKDNLVNSENRSQHMRQLRRLLRFPPACPFMDHSSSHGSGSYVDKAKPVELVPFWIGWSGPCSSRLIKSRSLNHPFSQDMLFLLNPTSIFLWVCLSYPCWGSSFYFQWYLGRPVSRTEAPNIKPISVMPNWCFC